MGWPSGHCFHLNSEHGLDPLFRGSTSDLDTWTLLSGIRFKVVFYKDATGTWEGARTPEQVGKDCFTGTSYDHFGNWENECQGARIAKPRRNGQVERRKG